MSHEPIENKKRKLGDVEGAEFVTCLQCSAEFVWHSGESILIDKSDHTEGFKWSCCDRFEHDKGCLKTAHKSVDVEDFAFLALKQCKATPSASSPILGTSKVEMKVMANGDHAKETSDAAAIHESEAKIDKEHPEKDSETEIPPKAEAKPEFEEAEKISESEVEESDDYEEEEREEQCVYCEKFYIQQDHKSYLSSEYCAWHEDDLILDPDCALSLEEQRLLNEENNPEWFIWKCCGEPAEDEGCNQAREHCPGRGRGRYI